MAHEYPDKQTNKHGRPWKEGLAVTATAASSDNAPLGPVLCSALSEISWKWQSWLPVQGFITQWPVVFLCCMFAMGVRLRNSIPKARAAQRIDGFKGHAGMHMRICTYAVSQQSAESNHTYIYMYICSLSLSLNEAPNQSICQA